jgi:predicted nucleic acid-binding protein
MKTVVMDTSALLRLFIPDGPVPDGAEDAIRRVGQGSAAILVPELALAEAGQVLLKKVAARVLKPEEARELLLDILALPLQLFSHKPLLPRAFELAGAHGVTVYDALFLSLAEKYEAILVTADDEMRKTARKMLLTP